MRPERTFGLTAVVFLLALFIGSAGQAQDLPPVQVDMSVLNSMDPGAGLSAARPTNQKNQPTPLTRRSGSISSPPSENNVVYRPPATAAKRPTASELVYFPVKVQDRTEQYDPSLGMPSPEPLFKHAKKPAIDTSLPDLKPVKVAERKIIKVPPVPPQRPAIQKAPESFVQEAKKAAAFEIKGSATMPAVPAKAVMAEPLKAPINLVKHDPLGKQLVTPDKYALAKSIEDVTEMIAARPQPLAPAAPVLSRIDATPLHKPKKEEVKQQASLSEEPVDITELAAIEPASGGNTASMLDISEVPRQPPEDEKHELEYISLPFSPGLVELDGTVTAALDGDVLPLLKNNPNWRLQIQAFASKSGSELENARRTSLSRALSIRSHLLSQGIEARRMDVRAMGMETDRKPLDRVDFVFFDPTLTD